MSDCDPPVAPAATATDTVTATPSDKDICSLSGSYKEAEAPLSKKARKRLLRAERVAAQRLERRVREKAAKKEKRKEKAAKRAAGEDVGGLPDKKRPRTDGTLVPFKARVVVDLGFDDKMFDKEIVSLCSQLAYTYNSHRKATQPFAWLLYTSLNGRTFTRLESMSNAGYKRWTGTEWWPEGYDRLWMEAEGGATNTSTQSAEKHQVLYLTADSDEELLELRENETYIIGGICDHNRYKNLCQLKAKADGIRTARLPISKYMVHLPTRKVLTVNQVFDILLKWVETRDWEAALYHVVPKRKFQGTKVDVDDCASKDGPSMNEVSSLDDRVFSLPSEITAIEQ